MPRTPEGAPLFTLMAQELLKNKTDPSSSEWLDPEVVGQAFQQVIDDPGRKRGPKPTQRVDRLRRVFEGRENEPILVDEFNEAFDSTNDPRANAQTAISWLNGAFKRLNIDLEIVSETKRRVVTATAYHLQSRQSGQKK